MLDGGWLLGLPSAPWFLPPSSSPRKQQSPSVLPFSERCLFSTFFSVSGSLESLRFGKRGRSVHRAWTGGGCVCDTSLEPGPSQDCPPSPPNEKPSNFRSAQIPSVHGGEP